MSGRVRRTALCALDALWTGLIFSQSLRPGSSSSQESTGLTVLLQRLPVLRPADSAALEAFLRKAAHFTEFAVLGILAALTLAAFGTLCRRAWAPCALAGLLAALCDETLQLFMAGRSSAVADVWLDWAGFLTGAALAAWLIKRQSRSRCRNQFSSDGQPGPGPGPL